MPLLLALAAPTIAETRPWHAPRLLHAVRQAIRDEIGHGISATKVKDLDQYVEQVPDDYRISEDDSTITDKAALRAKQTQAWTIIRRAIALTIDVTKVVLCCAVLCCAVLCCAGERATVWTDQRWDRQMLGKHGVSEFNVVTTQKHIETWKLAVSRWVNSEIKELGGTVMVDRKRR